MWAVIDLTRMFMRRSRPLSNGLLNPKRTKCPAMYPLGYKLQCMYLCVPIFEERALGNVSFHTSGKLIESLKPRIRVDVMPPHSIISAQCQWVLGGYSLEIANARPSGAYTKPGAFKMGELESSIFCNPSS